ncbi:MAG: hypothetical protein LBL07_14515 [Tannerella sp.]|jgi:hypothetical protein|nr:hypothetical protein [Tannerella sp.]
MGTDNRDIAKIIKDQHDNVHGAPELVFDDDSQNIIAVPAGKAKDTGMPEVTPMGTDVFYSRAV